MGDVSSLTIQHAYPSLTKGVSDLADQMEELRTRVTTQFEELIEDVDAVDLDITRYFSNLRQGVESLVSRVGAVEQAGGGNMASGVLSASTVILDDATGAPLLSLSDLISRVDLVGQENSQLRADINSQGGFTLGSHTFTSMGVLESVLTNEMPGGGLVFVELFVDINILPCHNPNFDPGNASSLLTWDKATKDMSLKGYAPAARKTVRSFHEIVSALYTDGKEAIAGQKIAAFKSKAEWIGEDGRDGRRQRIEEKILTARIAAVSAIESRLPVGSKLRSLAINMVDRTYNWYVVLHRHLDAELIRLLQMNLDVEALLVLLSEEVIIMFTLIHNIRKKGLEFLMTVAPLDYMVRCIWLTIEIHGAMEDMIKHGLSSNGAINAAFVRFLTKQVAVTAAGKADSKVESWKQKLTDEMGKAVVVSNEAKASAKEALTVANKAKEDVKSLFSKNKDLKR
jgi:hypothetical protein